MAVKKSELYSSLWASCDALRGGMDASQYKDYILTLLFVKYVSDKFSGEEYADIEVPEGGSFNDMVALIGQKNIGEGINKVIAKLAETNNLRGVIDKVSFNDPDKLGKGQEMVDTLSSLIGIFRRPELDFSKNRTEGDDLIGDAYEYLMRKFATESGKSKGQFYTPAEVSRVLAKVIGISNETNPAATVYDPACGSGSLLIRALDEAPISLSGYGQEKDTTTAGLAKMNTVLHDKATTEIKSGNTFSDPQYFEENSDNTVIRRFDYIVANPPFSIKNWTTGLKEYGRFDGYGDRPPQKNGDYAWLMHILKSLKNTGKAAVILPHGVLFRSNAEATIRDSILAKGYIKGIIGLPTNLFYGTGIAACVLVIDKEDADNRSDIFMIDASHDFVKDGNKNRLRERDVYKIVKTFNERIIDDPGYARAVPMSEISEKNGNNLNLSRYFEQPKGDLQNIDGHLNGGIPAVDIDSMDKYWTAFPEMKTNLFSALRDGFYKLNIPKDEIHNMVYDDDEFSAFAEKIDVAFSSWRDNVDGKLRNINSYVIAKDLIQELADTVLAQFDDIELIDKYDVYQVLLAYWLETMADDIYLLVHDGYEAGHDLSYTYVVKTEEKDGKKVSTVTDKVKDWDGKLIPKGIIINEYFAEESKAVEAAEIIVADTQSSIDEMLESADDDSIIGELYDDKNKFSATILKEKLSEMRSSIHNEEIDALEDLLKLLPLKKAEIEAYIRTNPVCASAKNDKGSINATSVKNRIAELRLITPVSEEYSEDYDVLVVLDKLLKENSDKAKILKELRVALNDAVKSKYPTLSIEEIKELLVNKKWYYSIFAGIEDLYTAVSHNLTSRITVLAERYENTLPKLEKDAADLEAKVKSHLERMGFKW